jgi:hypothetical protein
MRPGSLEILRENGRTEADLLYQFGQFHRSPFLDRETKRWDVGLAEFLLVRTK